MRLSYLLSFTYYSARQLECAGVDWSRVMLRSAETATLRRTPVSHRRANTLTLLGLCCDSSHSAPCMSALRTPAGRYRDLTFHTRMHTTLGHA
jgi:hypothetical protein